MTDEIVILLIIFISIMVLLKKKLDLGLNLLFNSLLMGFLFQIEFRQICILCKEVAINPATLELLGIIFLVYLLSIVLEKLNKFKGIVCSLQEMIKDYRWVMILISSFVALLPIQGGAIFSAPMIKSIGETNQIESEKNMFINYWFRHIWIFIWPLYPDVILYASLLGIPLKNLIAVLSPFAIIAFLSGTIWVYRNLSNHTYHKQSIHKNYRIAVSGFIQNTWPVLAVIMFTLFFNVSLLISLVLVIISLLVFHQEIRNHLAILFLESIKASQKTLLLVSGVLIFKGIIEYSKIVDFLPDFFLSIGIPLCGILVLVPFLIGFLTGSTIAYVGICVPVFFVFLVDANGIFMSRIALLYLAGYLGLMITPIHLCMVITKDYFHIRISHFYYILITHLAILGLLSSVYIVLLKI